MPKLKEAFTKENAKLIRKHRRTLAMSFLLSVIFSLSAALPQSVFGKIMKIVDGKDTIFGATGIWAVLICLIVLTLFSVFTALAKLFNSVQLDKIGQDYVLQIRMQTFKKILSFSAGNMQKNQTGSLTSRVCSSAEELYYFLSALLPGILENIFLFVSIFIYMLIISPILTLYMLINIPVLIILTLITTFFTKKSFDFSDNQKAKINGYLAENFRGMKITQVFGKQAKKNAEFQQQERKLLKANLKIMLMHNFLRPVIFGFSTLARCYLFYVAFNLILKGVISDIYIVPPFYILIETFFHPILWFSEQFVDVQSTLVASSKINKILKTEPEIKENAEQGELLPEVKKFDIEFKDVWFEYTSNETVLKGINFQIESGKTYSFVGKTGSGKTTILNLLTRQFDIKQGQILIDKKDISNYSLAALRSKIGVMQQDVYLFNDTIFANITLNNPEITREKVLETLDFLGCRDLILRYKKGLDHVLEENGKNLSAGERQLISFARTICKDPLLILLDEATANIDTKTESIIQSSLDKIKGKYTLIVVAHRLSTIQNSHCIFVLKNGKIKESGTHQELLLKKGEYFNYYPKN